MLKTDLITSANNSNVNVVAKTNKETDIVKRLQELNKWQEEQKKLLEVKQIMQRQMLGMEQQSMYQMLGLQSELPLLGGDPNNDHLERLSVQSGEEFDEYNEEESMQEGLETLHLNAEEEIDEHKDINPASYRNRECESEVATELPIIRTKRPFLRRGEGLKQRFKIDPNELRLNNLPKYQYANAHARFRLNPKNKSNKSIKCLKSNSNNTVKTSTTSKQNSVTITSLDANEQRFQNLLITSKNTCSSTPDTKSSFTTKNITSDSLNNIGDENINFNDENPMQEIRSKNEIKGQPVDSKKIIAWSKILDPKEIEPLQVPRNCKQSLPETEESIFELLEQKANDGSFDMDSSCLKAFLTRRIAEKLNESDDNIPVQDELKEKSLKPVILQKKLQDAPCSSSDEMDEQSQITEGLESSESDDSTHRTVETVNSSNTPQAPQARVRFSASNDTHEYDEEHNMTTNGVIRLAGGAIEEEDHSDINKTILFTQFKETLFAALQFRADQHLSKETSINSVSNTTLTPKASISALKNCDNNNSIYSPACTELQEKTEMIKIRLADLEKEIQVFKDNNIVLMKAKQEHELQKSLHAQEHLEAMESLKDEKIRMEIYLHDERVKMQDENRQSEQNLKVKIHGSLAKERKECVRLREQLGQLEMQLKSKDNNHTAAQARLRTQIRNMEREQSKLHEQIESLTRENKRLENENLKISREQNNKILLEINRNIAKLAPANQIQHTSKCISDEGPPTLSTSKTVSKCIVGAATANKNTGKIQNTTSTRLSNAKTVPNKKTTSTVNKEEPSTQNSFVDVNQQRQQHNIMNLDEEDAEDILKEFSMTPEKLNNIDALNHVNVKHIQKSLPKNENTLPEAPPSSPRSTVRYSNNNMKREIVNSDGSKDIWYPNGNLKKISADGMIIRMLYYNKDIKVTNINEGTVKYYYAETNTWHTTYLDGLEILEFPNGQVEHRHKNGIVEVHYPNNSVKITDAKDEHKQEEWRFPDGTHLVQMRNGDKILSLANGQKEIHNKLHKRREYPDGTVRIVYPDGSIETRYCTGRIRLKDKDGKLVMDTDMAK